MSEVKRYGHEQYNGRIWFEERDDGKFCSFDDYATLKAQRDALAAENAMLKVISNDRRVFIMNGVQLGYIKVPTVETGPALETIRIAVSPQEQTPATDAYLNSVRAEGADKVAQYHFVRIDALKEVSRQGHLFHKAAYSDAVNVANLFRAGKGLE